MLFLVALFLCASVLAVPTDVQSFGKGIVPGDDGVTNILRNPVSSRSILVKRSDVCRNASYEEFDSSPLRDQVLGIAAATWGSNPDRKFTNPPDLYQPPFQFCFNPNNVQEASFTDVPVCNSQTSELGGTVVNGTADVSITVKQGVTSTHEVSVTNSFTTTSTTDLNLEFQIADLFSAGVKESVSVSGTFTDGDSKTTTIDQETTEQVTAHATHPGKCSVLLNVSNCQTSATAQVQGYFKGSVWFHYDKKVNGHWYWAVIVDEWLSDNERSSPITLSDKVHSVNAGNFTAGCS